MRNLARTPNHGLLDVQGVLLVFDLAMAELRSQRQMCQCFGSGGLPSVESSDKRYSILYIVPKAYYH